MKGPQLCQNGFCSESDPSAWEPTSELRSGSWHETLLECYPSDPSDQDQLSGPGGWAQVPALCSCQGCEAINDQSDTLGVGGNIRYSCWHRDYQMPNAELRMMILMEDSDNDQRGGEREKG